MCQFNLAQASVDAESEGPMSDDMKLEANIFGQRRFTQLIEQAEGQKEQIRQALLKNGDPDQEAAARNVKRKA